MPQLYSRAILARSFTDDLYEHAFLASSIELVVENVLPRPQVQLAVSNGNHHLTPHDLPLVVKGDVDLAMLNLYIGAHDPKIRAKNDKLVCPSLLTLGFVKASDGDDATTYTITAAGRKALEAAK